MGFGTRKCLYLLSFAELSPCLSLAWLAPSRAAGREDAPVTGAEKKCGTGLQQFPSFQKIGSKWLQSKGQNTCFFF